MARFSTDGLADLVLSTEEVALMPEEIVDEMLEAGGAVVEKYHKAELSSQGLVKTAKLRDSIGVYKKRGRSGDRYVLIYPYGKRGEYHRKAVVKAYKRSKHGRTYTVGGDTKEVTNNDVGFVHEFGAPKRGIAPRQWMRTANEKASADVVAAESEVYDRFLKSKNL